MLRLKADVHGACGSFSSPNVYDALAHQFSGIAALVAGAEEEGEGGSATGAAQLGLPSLSPQEEMGLLLLPEVPWLDMSKLEVMLRSGAGQQQQQQQQQLKVSASPHKRSAATPSKSPQSASAAAAASAAASAAAASAAEREGARSLAHLLATLPAAPFHATRLPLATSQPLQGLALHIPLED